LVSFGGLYITKIDLRVTFDPMKGATEEICGHLRMLKKITDSWKARFDGR